MLDIFLEDALNSGKLNLVEEIVKLVKNQELVVKIFYQALSLNNHKIIKAAFESGFLSEQALIELLMTQSFNINVDQLFELYPTYTKAINELFRFAMTSNNVEICTKIVQYIKSHNQILSPMSIVEWSSIYSLLDIDMVNAILNYIKEGVIDSQIFNVLLCKCIMNDDPCMLETFIQNGVNMNKALEYACIFSSVDSIRILIEHDATVTQTLLDLCYLYPVDFCIELLENKFEQQYIKKEQDLFKQFCKAIIEDDTETCIRIIENGLSPFYITKSPIGGTYSLMICAVANCDRKLVSYLRSKGVNVPSDVDIINLFYEEDEQYSETKAKMIMYLLDIGALDLNTVEGDIVDLYREETTVIKENWEKCIKELKNKVQKISGDLKISITIKARHDQLIELKQMLEELDQTYMLTLE
jgi:hypothetical protein